MNRRPEGYLPPPAFVLDNDRARRVRTARFAAARALARPADWDDGDDAVLRQSEELRRLLFEHSPHPMWVFDEETLKLLAVNEAAVGKYGWSREEFLSMTVGDLHARQEGPAPVPGRVEQAPLRDTRSLSKHRTRDGGIIDVEVTTQPFRFADRGARLVMAIDVTDRRRLEDKLRWSQQMEAVGRLAGGVAHDFNNILTAINGHCYVLTTRLGPKSPLGQEASEIQKDSDRAAALSAQLLAFGRRQALAPKLLNLNAIVAEMEKMLRRLIGEDIELTSRLEVGLGLTWADPGQIEQVLINLAVNARDAMPSGGRLAIQTSSVTLDDEYASHHVGVTPGRYVLLSVSDTGCGIDKETQNHIFEPFFTTKNKDKGTGLGLATVYGIVKQSGGDVCVYSEPGLGATFKVYLPLADAAAQPLPALDKGPFREWQLRGTETILVVEDDEMVRRMVRRTLERLGYRVLEAGLGAEALRICERWNGPVDLLIADVIMPQMGGAELARDLAPRRPGMKVIFMSGYSESITSRHDVPREDGAFLEKPFTPAALASKVREMLDQ